MSLETTKTTFFDTVIVGGGLAGCLAGWFLRQLNPGRSVCVIEQGELGGNHTWCFHESDLSPDFRVRLAPWIEHEFSGYSVRFPSHARSFESRYACVTSTRLRSVMNESGCILMSGIAVTELRSDCVVLEDGTQIDGTMILDARGPDHGSFTNTGFQKFVGLEFELSSDHSLTAPILMDADVPQNDGYRFFYVLPFTRRRVLVEETHFSKSSEIDGERWMAEVHRYAERLGQVERVLREERGVLGMPLTTPVIDVTTRPLKIGYGAGWFHPGTGYSFPVAAEVAWTIATGSPQSLRHRMQTMADEQTVQARYLCMLNRLLFTCFEPGDMRNVFERFYRLPQPLIERFYARKLSGLDRARILFGAPPKGVSLGKATQVLREVQP